MDRSWLVFAASNLLSFGLSGVMWRWIIYRELRPAVEQEPAMDTETPDPEAPVPRDTPRQVRVTTVVFATILAACLVLVGFGLQQRAFQDQQDDHDTCVETWGGDLIDAVSAARSSSRDLAAVVKVRDTKRAHWENAYSQIVTTLLTLGPDSTPAEQQHFSDVLRHADSAGVKLQAAQDDVDEAATDVTDTQDANPLPRLRCGN